MGEGYVGVGKVIKEITKIKNFAFDNLTLNDFNIDPRIIAGTLVNNELVEELKHIRKTLFRNAYNNEKTEYAVKIEWKRFKERKNAFWKRNFGLFASRLIQCSLEKQPTTIKFIEECFKFKF